MPQQSAPTPERLRKRGSRRVEFAIGGALIGSMIGLGGWIVEHQGIASTTGGWSSTVVSMVALAVAGALGGTILGALLVVEIEDGENEALDEEARATGDTGAVRDETDAQDVAGPADRPRAGADMH